MGYNIISGHYSGLKPNKKKKVLPGNRKPTRSKNHQN